ncbi:type II and III secretion system protein [Akkermansiaceae bacterium]|nr:type II and III secretion system protein [Akkermansiaceae bacterium]MDB4319917.1 type II and III secretion system protein [bacterium]MDA7684133.1 type II and III secretion system protein [Akkermansiaceae bacterium]MDB4143412.1 type II and III secretion system protein [Akkermansiaceae bacterium]MDB4692788.1 type II and III secretion system protein [Akkermansiaceae bacterium]
MQKRHTHLTNCTVMALAALAVSPLAHGQGSLPAQELIRRQAAVQNADELLIEGRKAYAEGDYDTAVAKYRTALNDLPYGTATTQRRAVLIQHLQDGAVALAQNQRRMGKYDEARNLLTEVADADPGNTMAQQQLEYLDDPIRTNQALTYDHTQNIEKVRHELYRGEGAYDLGLYDKAEEHFHNVLRTDPYNKAARRWLERCASIKSDYYRAAYDENRARMLMEVDKAWELSLPPVGFDGPQFTSGPGENAGTASIAAKLQQIIIPVIDFQDTTVQEAIDFLRVRSKELDTTTNVEADKGINFVVKGNTVTGAGGDAALDADAGGLGGGNTGGARIDSLSITNVPLGVALQYICEKARLRYKVDEYAVTLLPIDDTGGEDIVTRRWTVPPTFINFIEGGGGGDGGGGGGDDPFADADDGGGGVIKARESVKVLLERNGVKFADGASANILNGTLIVRSAPTQLELVDAIVKESFNETPRQIKILTKFVEVSQENGEELGFDWVITPFGTNRLFAGGGTVGSGSTRTGSDFISPVNFTTIPGIPAASGDSVSGIATAGNRSGDFAINRNNIDAILNNSSRTAQRTNVAPGILSLTGLFSQGQVQMIMRGLSQKKGTDVMTAPSVMARPGDKATIEIIREFIYPTEYEPPELPNSVGATGGLGGGAGGGGGAGIFPVTPATPTTFDTRKTGVILEIEPNVGADNNVIDLRFAPEIVEFEGFVNYGSPITSPASDALGNPVQIVITENRIEMPIFSTRKVSTGITIYDGYTVAVGGLMREDVQSVEDKVPVLGDLPFIGRLFQTKAENHIKSNLIIFVTAEIIDATGRRVKVAGGGSDVPGMGGAGGSILPPGP